LKFGHIVGKRKNGNYTPTDSMNRWRHGRTGATGKITWNWKRQGPEVLVISRRMKAVEKSKGKSS